MAHESQLPVGTPSETHPPRNPGLGPGYEVRDVKVGGIVAFIVGLFLSLTIIQFSMWGMLKAISGGKPEAADPLLAPEVAGRQHETLRHNEDAILGGYGWADPSKKSGPVRIPIDRAIDLLAERGVPSAAGPARTEVEVNSHHGTPAPAAKESRDRPEPERKGEPEKKANK